MNSNESKYVDAKSKQNQNGLSQPSFFSRFIRAKGAEIDGQHVSSLLQEEKKQPSNVIRVHGAEIDGWSMIEPILH